jgi:hypothetical protein
VDEQYVHLLCDTSTHVFFVRFGSKCHNTAAENGTLRNGTLQNGKLQNGLLQNDMLQSSKYVAKQYSITKRYRYKMVQSLKALHVTK